MGVIIPTTSGCHHASRSACDIALFWFDAARCGSVDRGRQHDLQPPRRESSDTASHRTMDDGLFTGREMREMKE